MINVGKKASIPNLFVVIQHCVYYNILMVIIQQRVDY